MSENKKKGGVQFKGERTKSTLIIAGALIIYLLTLHFNIKIGYTAITAVISAMATFELERAAGVKNKLLHTIACTVSAGFVFCVGYGLSMQLGVAMVLFSFYALLLLCLAVGLNKTIKYNDAVVAFFASLAIPYSLSIFIRFNQLPVYSDTATHLEGLFLLWFAFSCSWLTDVFAFLVGRKIGKHKMTPHISPKKSFEGAIFGTLITAAINVLILLVYSLIATKAMGYETFLTSGNVKYIVIVPVSIVLSVVSMFGDLAASVLKRNVGIKDYSNILPGHGGIMDRFDSCLFVLPVLWGIYTLMFLV